MVHFRILLQIQLTTCIQFCQIKLTRTPPSIINGFVCIRPAVPNLGYVKNLGGYASSRIILRFSMKQITNAHKGVREFYFFFWMGVREQKKVGNRCIWRNNIKNRIFECFELTIRGHDGKNVLRWLIRSDIQNQRKIHFIRLKFKS